MDALTWIQKSGSWTDQMAPQKTYIMVWNLCFIIKHWYVLKVEMCFYFCSVPLWVTVHFIYSNVTGRGCREFDIMVKGRLHMLLMHLHLSIFFWQVEVPDLIPRDQDLLLANHWVSIYFTDAESEGHTGDQELIYIVVWNFKIIWYEEILSINWVWHTLKLSYIEDVHRIIEDLGGKRSQEVF